MHHSLEISDDSKHVTKFFEDSELLKLEALRTTEAHEICKNCDFLSVPRIVSTNDRSITFDYYPHALTFADLLIQDFGKAVELIPLVAKSLVFLQKNLRHTNKIDFVHSQKLSVGNGVFVHGDYSVHNLLSQNNSLVLVDWSSSNWGGAQFNHAPEHWDLAWFVLGIYLIPYIRKLSFARRDFVANTLLNKYLEQGDFSQRSQLASFALTQHAHFFSYNRKTSEWFENIREFPNWYRCRRFWKHSLNERT